MTLGASVVTAGEAKAVVDRVDVDLRRLDAAIRSSGVGRRFRRGWVQFLRSWQTFLFEEKGRPSPGTVRTALAYAAEARQWCLALAREKASRAAGDGVGGLGGPRVDAAMEQILTAEQARAVLDAAENHLRTAWERTAEVPLIAAAAGVREALRSGVQNVRDWIKKVRPQLPPTGALHDETLRRKVALAVVQAGDQLKRVDESVNDPQLQFWPNFTAGLKQIATTAERALPWKPVVIGLGGLVLLGAVLGRRGP